MPSSHISESKSILAILKLIQYNSVLLVDLDNTAIETQSAVGGDQWFVRACLDATALISHPEQALTMVLAIYHEIQKIVRVQAVESVTVKIINALLDIGIPVIAITARDECLRESTARQLQDIGIDMTKLKMIYCSGQDKGNCFQEYIKANPALYFKHVVMVDDKLKYLQQVKSVVNALGIGFNGVRYGYLDEKVAAFDMNEAHVQLAYVEERLPSHLHPHIQSLGWTRELAGRGRYPHFFYHRQEDSFEGRKECASSP